MKTKVSFLDANRNRIKLEMEITNRNGFPEFSIMGDCGNGSGQIVDEIKPATGAQKEIIKLWHDWHLNGMSSGTPLQDKILSDLPGDLKHAANYESACMELIHYNRAGQRISPEACAVVDQLYKDLPTLDNLNGLFAWIEFKALPLTVFIAYGVKPEFDIMGKLAGITDIKEARALVFNYVFSHSLLYDQHPTTGQPFKYGTGWIRKTLPDNFTDELNRIINQIKADERSRKAETFKDVTDEMLIQIIEQETEFNGDDAITAAGLVRIFDLCRDDLSDIENVSGNTWKVQGVYYLAGDDAAMEGEHDAALESYLDECILPELPETAQRYFDRDAWKKDAEYDGRAHALNHYDGGEEEADIKTAAGLVTVYAYRQ